MGIQTRNVAIGFNTLVLNAGVAGVSSAIHFDVFYFLPLLIVTLA